MTADVLGMVGLGVALLALLIVVSVTRQIGHRDPLNVPRFWRRVLYIRPPDTPAPEDAPPELIKQVVRERFADFGAAHELTDQDRHPAMHRTETLDIICLISGEASLVLDNEERRLKPGNIIIQRGTSHGWTAYGGPALFLAVLIDRH